MTPETPEEMLARLVEAVEVIAIIGKGDGPRTAWATWPDPNMIRKVKRQRICSAQEIARAEEAMTWWALIDDIDARRALQYEVMCKAGGGKFTQVCKKYGWERSTVLKRNRVVLKKLSEKLALGDVSRRAA
ncbi:hypothetical protein [Labrenzia sp. OB1]|uniref:hypothetical protein n=1 Tax=Labrenzia sp. OB1 TaxID=1561204 RepID=UPI000AA884F9|nr:hypothetical protein [Labrenzia sp. OB1]